MTKPGGSKEGAAQTPTQKRQAELRAELNTIKSTQSSKKSSKSSNSTRSTTTTETNTQSMSKIASAFGTPSADPRVLTGQSTNSKEASTNNAFNTYVGGWTCTSGEILCAPDGQSWAMCSNSQPVYMGLVAAGTVCRFGAIVASQGW